MTRKMTYEEIVSSLKTTEIDTVPTPDINGLSWVALDQDFWAYGDTGYEIRQSKPKEPGLYILQNANNKMLVIGDSPEELMAFAREDVHRAKKHPTLNRHPNSHFALGRSLILRISKKDL